MSKIHDEFEFSGMKIKNKTHGHGACMKYLDRKFSIVSKKMFSQLSHWILIEWCKNWTVNTKKKLNKYMGRGSMI